MENKQQPIQIFQSRKGISLVDGFYLARNPQTKKVMVLSISKGIVYTHVPAHPMTITNLANMDAIGMIEIFEKLDFMELERQKSKNKKQ